MHADSLFTRMLKHEAAVETAKKEGLPIPVFETVVPKAKPGMVAPSEELQATWKGKLDKLPEDERAAEEAALRADLQAKADVVDKVQQIWDTQREERKTRQQDGTSTFGDYLASLFGKTGK